MSQAIKADGSGVKMTNYVTHGFIEHVSDGVCRMWSPRISFVINVQNNLIEKLCCDWFGTCNDWLPRMLP